MGASLYDRAGTCYRNAKMFDKSAQAFQLASEAHYSNDMPYSAGKSLEQAGSMWLEAKQTAKGVAAFQQASMYYREDGKSDKGAELLIKAAEQLGGDDAEDTMRLFDDALELLADENQEYKAGATYKKAISFAMKNNMTDGAIQILERQIKACEGLDQKHQVHKCRLSIVICHLVAENPELAHAYQSESLGTDTTGYPGSEEANVASDLLAAYQGGDEEVLKSVTDKQMFTFLDNEIARAAKKLKPDGGLV